tara:strand:+ start:570 stop:788 length:219 start_codon:yes stop_codon:yes gene_type:complete
MQKLINAAALFSGVVSLAVVGTVGYVFIRKDAIIEGVKSKVAEQISGSLLQNMPSIDLPSSTGPALPDMPKF